jgi:secretion/DNA translocation related CpaE-like protein
MEGSTTSIVLTDQPELLEELRRLCAAAGVTAEVVGDTGSLRERGWHAGCVLVGDDRAGEVARLSLSRRGTMILVSRAPESARLWQQGVAMRADDVVVLPDGQRRLVERLTDLADGADGPCLTLGVVPAHGGAGASTLAAGLAITAAGRGRRSLIVDADPWGGGIDLMVGCEEEPGLRWPDLAETRGRVGAAALRAALPTADGLAVLSWAPGKATEVPAETVGSLLRAGQRGADLVVVDHPRRVDATAGQLLAACDVVLLVTAARIRAAAAAAGCRDLLRRWCVDTRLVVRAASRDVDAHRLADQLGLPLAAVVPHRRGVERAVEQGLGPAADPRLRKTCARLLDAVDPAEPWSA